MHATARNFFIFKGNAVPGKDTIDQLRPISATSIIFKMLEIVLKKRIEEAVKSKRIKQLDATQYGFRPYLGTEP